VSALGLVFSARGFYGRSVSVELGRALVASDPPPRWDPGRPSVAYALLKLLVSDHPDRLELAKFAMPYDRASISASAGESSLAYRGSRRLFWVRIGGSVCRAGSLQGVEPAARAFWAGLGVSRVAHMTPSSAYVLEVVSGRPVVAGESLLSIPDVSSPEAWKNLGRDTEYLRSAMGFLSKHLGARAATGYMVKVGNNWLEYSSLPPEKRTLAAALIAAPNADIVVAEALDTVLAPEGFRAFLDAASAAEYALVVAYSQWAAETAASAGWAVHTTQHK